MKPLPRRLSYGEEATLVEHLGELRTRLVVSLLSLVLTVSVAYSFHGRLLNWIEQVLPHERRKLVTFSVAEPFVTSMWLSIYAGVVLALPILLYQVWAFLAPAFDARTQRIVVGLVGFATALAALGVVFGRYVVLPAAVHFLTNYDSNLYDIQVRARDYISFAILVMAAVGVVFELPIVVLALVRLGILTTKKLRTNRRIGYVIVAAVAVALPGIDPVTTTLEAIPLLVLYEATIWVAVVFERRWRPEPGTAEVT